MSSINLSFKNNIKISSNNQRLSKKLSKNFNEVYLSIKKDIKDKEKTLNVLDDKFKFNCAIKDLKKFKKFKNFDIIGMGGSILGAEAIYNFLGSKIKKEIFFLMILTKAKFQVSKKIKTYQKYFSCYFQIRKYNRNII